MSRGAPKAPITYEGEHDPTRTYLPRQMATKGGVAYLSVATSTGVTPDPASQTPWLPLGAGGGAALLGYAELSITAPTSFQSDGFTASASAISIDASVGDPDLTAVGDALTYSAAGDGIYLTNAYLVPVPGANCVAADVHDITFGGDPVLGDVAGCQIGVAASTLTGTGTLRVASPTSYTPYLSAECTGGIDRVYSISGDTFYLYVMRFAIPS